MKAEMFDKIVKARTDELVDRKIGRFRDAVYRELESLLGIHRGDILSGGILKEEAKEVLKIMSREYRLQKWPRELWESETKKVTAALLQTFDEFTQAKLASDEMKEPKNKMEEVKKPAVDGLESEDDDTPF